jgi:hypothetical protein
MRKSEIERGAIDAGLPAGDDPREARRVAAGCELSARA